MEARDAQLEPTRVTRRTILFSWLSSRPNSQRAGLVCLRAILMKGRARFASGQAMDPAGAGCQSRRDGRLLSQLSVIYLPMSGHVAQGRARRTPPNGFPFRAPTHPRRPSLAALPPVQGSQDCLQLLPGLPVDAAVVARELSTSAADGPRKTSCLTLGHPIFISSPSISPRAARIARSIVIPWRLKASSPVRTIPASKVPP